LGNSDWTLGSPFFPPVDGGLDRLGSDLVDLISDLELGLPEELVLGFEGQEPGDLPEFVLGRLSHGLEEPLGFVLLFGGEVVVPETRHGWPSVKGW